jgi:hypothetical protein
MISKKGAKRGESFWNWTILKLAAELHGAENSWAETNYRM